MPLPEQRFFRAAAIAVGVVASWMVAGVAKAQVTLKFSSGSYGQLTGCNTGGRCTIKAGKQSGDNEFFLFGSFKTQGNKDVFFDNQKLNVIAGVSSGVAEITDPVIFAQPGSSFILLTPGGISISGSGGFASGPLLTPLSNLVLSTASKLTVFSGIELIPSDKNTFDVLGASEAAVGSFSGPINYARSGTFDPGEGRSDGLQYVGEFADQAVSIKGVTLTVERSLMIASQQARIEVVKSEAGIPSKLLTTAAGSLYETGTSGIHFNGDFIKIEGSELRTNGEISLWHSPDRSEGDWILKDSIFGINGGPVIGAVGKEKVWAIELFTNGFGTFTDNDGSPIDPSAPDQIARATTPNPYNPNVPPEPATAFTTVKLKNGVRVDRLTIDAVATSAGSDLETNKFRFRLVFSDGGAAMKIGGEPFTNLTSYGDGIDGLGQKKVYPNIKANSSSPRDPSQGLLIFDRTDQLVANGRDWSIQNIFGGTDDFANPSTGLFDPSLAVGGSIDPQRIGIAYSGFWFSDGEKTQAALRIASIAQSQPKPPPTQPQPQPQPQPQSQAPNGNGSDGNPGGSANGGRSGVSGRPVAVQTGGFSTTLQQIRLTIDNNIVQDFDNSPLAPPGPESAAVPVSTEGLLKSPPAEDGPCDPGAGVPCGRKQPGQVPGTQVRP
jgi:hypothetical protein